MEELTLCSVLTRLARTLVRLAEVSGSLELQITLEELAQWVGAHRGEISTHLARLGLQGLVERTAHRYRRLVIRDLARLSSMAGGAAGRPR